MLRTLPLFLAILLACLLHSEATAQCTGCVPDQSCTVDPAFPTLCPLLPPDATAGVYYENDFTFWMPPTFSDPGSGFSVNFEQMTVTGVTGLPFGLQFQTSAPGNVFYPQQNAFGCARVCGVPLGAGTYTITISIIAGVSFNGIPINAPQSFQVPLVVLPGSGGNASFSFAPTSGCGSVSATFQALIDASPAPMSYAWDFGNGNTSTSPTPPVQTYDQPGTYVISLETTVGGYVLNTVTITGVNDAWCGDIEEPNLPVIGCTGSPDLYFLLTDARGGTTQSATVDNTTATTWTDLGILLSNAPYSLSVYDEDAITGDDLLGTYNIPANGAGTYFINVANGTTGSLSISNEPQQLFLDTDTVRVFPDPEVVLAENDLTGELCVANDTLVGYVWFLDGDTVPEANGPCFLPTGAGLWQVVGTNGFGCTATSNTVVVCPSATITRNGNVLFVPSIFVSYTWTFNGAAIGGNEAFVFTQGDGTYALTATDANGCVVTAEYVLNTVGIEEAGTTGLQLALYPNPNDGRSTLVAEGLNTLQPLLEVLDLGGRVVHQEQVLAGNGRLRHQLQLDVAPGSYLVRLTDGDQQRLLRMAVR